MQAGVNVFVGHYLNVGVPESPPDWSEEQKKIFEEATMAVFLAFLSGENREKALKKAVFDAIDDDDFALGTERNDGKSATGWGVSVLLQKIGKSLLVSK